MSSSCDDSLCVESHFLFQAPCQSPSMVENIGDWIHCNKWRNHYFIPLLKFLNGWGNGWLLLFDKNLLLIICAKIKVKWLSTMIPWDWDCLCPTYMTTYKYARGEHWKGKFGLTLCGVELFGKAYLPLTYNRNSGHDIILTWSFQMERSTAFALQGLIIYYLGMFLIVWIESQREEGNVLKTHTITEYCCSFL